MKIQSLLKAALVLAITTGLSACNDDDDNNNNAWVSFHPVNLEALGDDFDYEGWLIVDGEAVSTGKFDIEDGLAVPSKFYVEHDHARTASTFVLTIEPVENDPPEPAPTHILAGDIFSGSANLTLDHQAAVGNDFAQASGTYILATPSNGNTTPTRGIWYLNASSGTPQASLNLPTLPEGWVYEGWVVGDNGPITTGTFTDVAAADSDLGGPAAGPNATPPFPGQDFITPPMELVGKNAVISLEPSPDNDPSPFFIKPLAGEINNAGRTLGNNVNDDNRPSAVVNVIYR